MGVLEKVYDHAPVFAQNLMCSVSGFQKKRERYGKPYWEARAFCREFDSWPLERQLSYQCEALVGFLRDAAAQSPFYRELYQNYDLNQVKCVEDLKLLPVVDKEMLRANIERVYTVSAKDGVASNTGGTTGKSLTVRFRREDMQIRMAVLDHYKARTGFENLKMKRASFNGKHIIPPGQSKNVFWRYNRPCKQMIYSSFHLTEDKLGYYVNSLNRFAPQAIDGFFTSICDVASYIERHGIQLSFQPIGVYTTSETLNEEGRALIERVFGCKVYDQYASSEGAPFVTECPAQHLHLELHTGVIEYGENGEILVTSFTTRGTPLIRYAIGDVMEPEAPDFCCTCGLHSPVIRKIHGRRLDYLLRPDGAKINTVNTANLLKYLPNSVIRAQFHQKKLDELIVLLEVDPETFCDAHKAELQNECLHTFGPQMHVEIRVVEQIPRERSGKFRMIHNEIAD